MAEEASKVPVESQASDPIESANKEQLYFEMYKLFAFKYLVAILLYYDHDHKLPYFYNPKTGESIWELPKGAICADMTGGSIEQINHDQLFLEAKQEEIAESEQKKKWIEIEELKKKNMEAMYPEYYNNPENVNQDSDNEQQTDLQNQIDEFGRYKSDLNEDMMSRPARRQVKEIRKDTAYIEGNYDYNIWYDKYLTDQRQEEERVASLYKCDPVEDTGYTKADKFDKATYFCIYFARGCCSEGVNCKYFHRVPQPRDLRKDDIVKDCFGRTRHSTYKEDFSGIGSFANECKTLKICDISFEDRSRPVRDLLRIFYDSFAPWGELIDIHLNVVKCIGFVKYSHRYYAEFAREAMNNQVLFGGNDPISIKWAISNPFDRKVDDKEAQINQEFELLVKRKEVVQQHAQRAIKEINKKFGGKRKREDDLSEKLMDNNKRPKLIDLDPQEIPDSRQISENCTKLSNILQRIEDTRNTSN